MVPFPLGMVFVGNSELSLKVGENGATILDAGMEDRLLYKEPLTYDEVLPDDIAMFVRRAGIEDDHSINAIVRYFGQPKMPRSYRQITKLLDELRDEAGGGPVTPAVVRSVLNPA